MILKYYRKPKTRRNLSVLFLPSVEAYDYYEIFEPLGISPDNIIGFEIDKTAYKKNQAKKHPFKTVLRNVADFLEEEDERFDIISLDFKGMLTRDMVYLIKTIIGKPRLYPRGILHTNFFGRREPKSVKEWYDAPFQTFQGRKEWLAKFDLTASSKIEYNASDALSKRRDYGITNLIKDIAEVGISNVDLIEPFKEFCRLSNRPDAIDDKLQWGKIVEIIHSEFKKMSPTHDSFLQKIAILGFLIARHQKGYYPVEIDSFYYLNETRSGMYSDIFYFNQYPQLFNKQNFPMDLVMKKLSNGGIHLIDNVHSLPVLESNRQFNKCLRYAKVALNKLKVLDEIVPREFIGSAVKKRIKKDQAIELLLDGVTIPEILEEYTGLSVGQLSAYKAHVTMGTYKKKK
jgi:hypothetical protein